MTAMNRRARAKGSTETAPAAAGAGLARRLPTARAVGMASLAALTLPGGAGAQTAAAAEPSLLPMLLAFGLVLALLALLPWLLRRFGHNPSSLAQGAALKVVSQLPLGPRERIVVVEVGGRWLLLGVTAGAINRVGSLPRPSGAEAAAGGDAAPPSFRQLLRQVRVVR